MKQTWTLGVGVFALALAGCAGSSEAKRDAEGAIAGLEEQAEGTVVEVQGDWIAVRDAEDPQGPTVRFRRTQETDLVRDDEPFSWPQLTQGMPVRVSYEADAGAERATRIEVLTGSEADEIRSRSTGSQGWSRPEGITRPRGEGGPPPVDLESDGEPRQPPVGEPMESGESDSMER